MPSLTVDVRFCGPPGCANGGYFAGLLSQFSEDLVQVRIERPIPLQVPLDVQRDAAGALQLLHGPEILARAQPVAFELAVPPAPDYLQALDASRDYIGFSRHAFPNCFVCGPDRARGDGLRIFAGALSGRKQVAATWVPDVSLAGDDGKVRPEFMSAAPDCPGCFAARSDGMPMLLGECTVHVDRCVHIDEPCIVIGWRIGIDSRRYQVGTALFDYDGELCARALWIEPRPGVGILAGSAGSRRPPSMTGTAAALTEQRAVTLDAAFAAHPIRFKGIAPEPPALPTAAWINPPKKESTPSSITPASSLNS